MFGGQVIDALRRLKVGQEIREEGPKAHMAKRGTPTMGGVLIIGSVLISIMLWARLSSLYVWIVMITTLSLRAIGFRDDYIKVVMRRSLGLTGRKKLLAQLAIAIAVWAVLYLFTDYSWNVSVPFFKATADPDPRTSISNIGPYLYLPFIIVVLLGSSNAVNLTDGLDGLAISITFIAMTALTGFTYISGDARFAELPRVGASTGGRRTDNLLRSDGWRELGVLWFNAPPAEVFMGDVGSLAIGGAIEHHRRARRNRNSFF
ncbi:MAG: phospho-N-acetylmuramoyl-pentapeptide-transferase [Pyrinomonadaceae bacterium]